MIYCFKRLKKLKLLHIFFMHYGISLAVGFAIIAGLFLLGGGLQIFSIMVLCYMYEQPIYIMLRRMRMYEARAAIRDSDAALPEIIEKAYAISYLRPCIWDDEFIEHRVYIVIHCYALAPLEMLRVVSIIRENILLFWSASLLLFIMFEVQLRLSNISLKKDLMRYKH